MDMKQARFNMIEQQVRTCAVLDDTVLQTMTNIPRDLFVPETLKDLAYADMELPLSHDEVMMTPRVEGKMLQELEINTNDECLEIGTGSGFITACMASLSHHVDSLDIYADFIESAKSSLASIGVSNVTLKVKDALKGISQEKKYDVIAVTGSMPEYLPLFEKLLKPKGRLFVVVGSRKIAHAMKVVLATDNNFIRTNLFETNLKSLVGVEEKQNFRF